MPEHGQLNSEKPFLTETELSLFHGTGSDLRPKFPPALRGVLGFKSLALSRHLVHCLSLQEFHRGQVPQG